MHTQKKEMKKSDLIYIINNSIYKDRAFATLAICIHHKTKKITDVFTIEWHCSLGGKNKNRWQDMVMKCEYNNFNLTDLIIKLKALRMTPKSTVEQVIEMLKQAGVEQGLCVDVMDNRGRILYDRYLSESEIKEGSFIRHASKRKFTIQEKQQKELKATLRRTAIVDIDRLLKIAK